MQVIESTYVVMVSHLRQAPNLQRRQFFRFTCHLSNPKVTSLMSASSAKSSLMSNCAAFLSAMVSTIKDPIESDLAGLIWTLKSSSSRKKLYKSAV